MTSPNPAVERSRLPADLVDTRRRVPLFLAAVGVLALAVQAWVYLRWAVDGNAHAVPATGVAASRTRILVTRLAEIGLLGGFGVMLGVCWWRSRRIGQPTLSTALLIGYPLALWTDPISGAAHHAAGQNRLDLNVLTWGPELPGWHGPMPQIQTLTEGMAYPYAMMWAWAAMAAVTLVRRRWPRWPRPRVALIAVAATIAVDIPIETVYILLGGFSYPRILPHFTLYADHWYRLPLTSSVGMVLICALPVALMHLYTKPGHEAWLLDGSRQLPRPFVPWVRLLAGVGFINVCMLVFNLMMLGGSLVSHPGYLPDWMTRPT